MSDILVCLGSRVTIVKRVRLLFVISGVPALFVAAWAVVRATLADAR